MLCAVKRIWKLLNLQINENQPKLKTQRRLEALYVTEAYYRSERSEKKEESGEVNLLKRKQNNGRRRSRLLVKGLAFWGNSKSNPAFAVCLSWECIKPIGLLLRYVIF